MAKPRGEQIYLPGTVTLTDQISQATGQSNQVASGQDLKGWGGVGWGVNELGDVTGQTLIWNQKILS